MSFRKKAWGIIPMLWPEMKQQFREIARMFTSIEDKVLSQGKVDVRELDLMAATHQLSPLGMEVLGDFLRHSPKVQVLEEGEELWLIKNPDWPNEEDGEEEEEAITGIRDIVVPDPDPLDSL